MPLGREVRDRILNHLQAAVFRESFALIEDGIATHADIDRVVTSAIGRRWAVGGPFEIFEQIGWDLIQIIFGELFKEISVMPESPKSVTLGGVYQGIKFVPNPTVDPTNLAPSGPMKFERVTVVGAGLMGHGIALEFAAHGRQVCLHDISEELLTAAMERVRVGLEVLASAGRIANDDIEPSIQRISTSTDLSEAVKDADLVVEAASENPDLKKKIFAEIDKAAPEHAVLASNSSTYVPSAYGSATNRPSQVVGIHYYNPPHLLPGVEITKGADTSGEVVELVKREYELIGKQPAVVHREIQGFIGNRLQAALLREAMAIVESGDATAPQLDAIVPAGFGAEFARVGVFKGVQREHEEDDWSTVEEYFPDLANNRELPRLLLDKIESGDLGVKMGRGFYDWTPESAELWRANMARRLQQMASRDR